MKRIETPESSGRSHSSEWPISNAAANAASSQFAGIGVEACTAIQPSASGDRQHKTCQPAGTRRPGEMRRSLHRRGQGKPRDRRVEAVSDREQDRGGHTDREEIGERKGQLDPRRRRGGTAADRRPRSQTRRSPSAPAGVFGKRLHVTIKTIVMTTATGKTALGCPRLAASSRQARPKP
jgi:hypothetical protein